jgi:hypothetical protein
MCDCQVRAVPTLMLKVHLIMPLVCFLMSIAWVQGQLVYQRMVCLRHVLQASYCLVSSATTVQFACGQRQSMPGNLSAHDQVHDFAWLAMHMCPAAFCVYWCCIVVSTCRHVQYRMPPAQPDSRHLHAYRTHVAQCGFAYSIDGVP